MPGQELEIALIVLATMMVVFAPKPWIVSKNPFKRLTAGGMFGGGGALLALSLLSLAGFFHG